MEEGRRERGGGGGKKKLKKIITGLIITQGKETER